MANYRAYRNITLGVANEHAYNMFLSFEEICCRLGLWDNSVGWLECNKAFRRLTLKGTISRWSATYNP